MSGRHRPPSDVPVRVVIATRNRAGSLAMPLEHLLALPERPPVLVPHQATFALLGVLARPSAALPNHARTASTSAIRRLASDRARTPHHRANVA